MGPVGVQGIAVDIERGLRQKHFPIRVRYILTSDTYAPKTVESEDWVEGKDWICIYIYVYIYICIYIYIPSQQTNMVG